MYRGRCTRVEQWLFFDQKFLRIIIPYRLKETLLYARVVYLPPDTAPYYKLPDPFVQNLAQNSQKQRQKKQLLGTIN